MGKEKQVQDRQMFYLILLLVLLLPLPSGDAFGVRGGDALGGLLGGVLGLESGVTGETLPSKIGTSPGS